MSWIYPRALHDLERYALQLLVLTNLVACEIANINYFSTNATDSLTNVLFLNNNLYVGGKNYLYHLNALDLSYLNENKVGPVLDNQKCYPSPEPCGYERINTDNEIKVLLPYTSKNLIVCGSAYQGICSLRPTNDITKSIIIGNVKNVENYVGGNSTVLAILNNRTIYTAWSYDKRALKFSGHFISSRVMNRVENNQLQLAFSYKSEQSISAVDFLDDSFKINYRLYHIYGFVYGQYTYFISYEPVSAKSTSFETRLARVCSEDKLFNSYTEIALKCHGLTGDFNMATAAFLSNYTEAQRHSKRNLEGQGGALFVTFVRSKYENTVNDENGTVMCRFTMVQIEKAFEDATTDCFNGEPRTFRIDKIVGTGVKCSKKEDYVLEEVLCNPGSLNSYIQGREAIMGTLKTSFKEIATSLFVTTQHTDLVAFVGTNSGQVLKMNLKSNDPPILYNISVSSKQIEQINAADTTHQNLFLLSGNKVIKFPIGSCSLYETCKECLSVSQEPLQCGWCDGRCAHKAECEGEVKRLSCPPYIKEISPLNGPIEGGTLITIKGDNFGSGESGISPEKFLRVQINDSVCQVVRWEYTLIECKTSAGIEDFSSPITVEVDVVDDTFDKKGIAISEEEFVYKKATFYGVYPNFGPLAGGSNVTLFGENLDIGSNIIIMLLGGSCTIFRQSSSAVECTTSYRPNKGHENFKGVAQFYIDGNLLAPHINKYNYNKSSELHVHAYFEYMMNPDITNISPRVTIQSGGTNLRVIGNNLHSIKNPRLVLRFFDVTTEKKTYIINSCKHEEHRHQKGKVMNCLTPPLHGVSFGNSPTAKVPLEVYIYFIMDGVESLKNFSQSHRNISTLLYYPDPSYFEFSGKRKVFQVPIDEPVVIIKGSNLNLAHSTTDVSVSIEGPINCSVESLSLTSLRCVIPQSYVPLKAENQSLRLVQVTAGNRNFTIGSIQYVDPIAKLGVLAILGIVAACFVVLLLLLIVLYKAGIVRFCKKKVKGPNYAVTYIQDPAARRSNEYTDASQNLTNGGTTSGESQASVGGGGACGGAAGSSRGSLGDKRIPEETVRLLEADGILYPRNYLTVNDIIGQGHFGRVYRGILTLPEKEGRDVAVKTLNNLRYRDAEDCEIFLQEGLMMKDFHHHHVLTLIGVSIDEDGFPMVIIPYMAKGDLLSFIRNDNNYPTVKDLITYGIHVAEGMKYLSDLKFLHRDLAARNCMLDEDMVVKVADFGLSRDVYERDYYSSDNKKNKLPVKWMAPESLEKGTYSTKSDVWAFGVVLWELLTRGVTPYPEVGNWEILQYVKSGRRMPQPSYCPDLLYRLMLHCWTEDPKIRPAFGELAEELKTIIKKMEAKSKHQRVGTKVTYINCPVEDGPRYENTGTATAATNDSDES